MERAVKDATDGARRGTSHHGIEDDLKPVVFRTMSDQATERLRNAIQKGTLKPGAPLIERELAAKLGMSRVPIREAIHRLAEEGLVVKQPHRGTFVYSPSPREIEEIAALRILLEQYVVEQAMARWGEAHDDELRAVVRGMRAAARAGDRQRLKELDDAFHSALWRMADNGTLLDMASGLRQRVVRLFYANTNLLPIEELDEVVSNHEKLVNLLGSGDVAAAQADVRRHIEDTKRHMLEYARQAG